VEADSEAVGLVVGLVETEGLVEKAAMGSEAGWDWATVVGWGLAAVVGSG